MADVSVGYSAGPGGFYKIADRSGPYSVGPDGTATLLGSAAATPAQAFAPAPVTGNLAKAGDSITMSAPGAAGYIVWITPGTPNLVGTFATSDPTTGGGRRLFKTGVGPLEVSSEALDGTQPSLEYRTSGGGDGLKVALTSYTSGSATVKIFASYAPVMVFNNGPVHTTLEAAVRAGRGFKVGASAAISAGNVLNFVLSNPAGSGRNLFLNFRRFQQTSANVLQYQQFSNPAQFASGGTGVTNLTIANRRNDSAMTPVAVARMQMGTAVLTTGTPGVIGFIATGAVPDPMDLMDMLAPGTSIGYSFTGIGGGLFTGAAASLGAAFTHYEEGIV